ncbi:zinc ribbon domain-containing protein [Methanobrevibacter sp.]|uniref:zinc ribbon domain-containing protein n=1 Tax=Methanobrevibacter sp. TaxID=66852 RepID=UPI00388E0F9C
MVFCSKCGSENKDTNEICSECEAPLFTSKNLKLKKYNRFEEIFTDENLNILQNHNFSEDDYNTILENIKDMGHYNLDKITQSGEYSFNSILSKIAAIVAAYTPVNYKSRGAELGSYAFNLINVDDRLDSANQIATLIHELTHHLVSEIFEQILMYIWQVEKSDVIEAFVFFALTCNPIPILVNEYCAHSVEGRFVPHGYQNYGSFNNVLAENFDINKDMEIVIQCSIYGNTLANDLTKLFETFINENLREEIKRQFKIDYQYPPKYDQILFERKEIMAPESLIESIFTTLILGFTLAREKDAREILDAFENNYKEINQMQKTFG